MRSSFVVVTGLFQTQNNWLSSVLAHCPELDLQALDWETFLPTPLEFPFQNTTHQPLQLKSEAFLKSLPHPPSPAKPASSWRNFYTQLKAGYESYFLKKKKPQILPLLFEPRTLLLLEWLDAEFDIEVVILIQHPLFYLSRKEEMPDFNNFGNQPALVEHFFPLQAKRIEKLMHAQLPDFKKKTAYWQIMADIIRHYQRHYPHWCFWRYEDWLKQPLMRTQEFSDLLELSWSQNQQEAALQKEQPLYLVESQFKALPFEQASYIEKQLAESIAYFYPKGKILG
ncbi:hypothetical protein [Hugenholtzia roseola]|uniref:hypothetical protein n=1 Tax=Hugenholtzia roseola TaxID=1002 RepID=UPI00040A0BA6|nr:hypothetical protein [Hugenholtzia roseola]